MKEMWVEVIRDNKLRFKDLRVGLRIGRLLLRRMETKRFGPKNRLQRIWYCDCDCGKRDIAVCAENLCRPVPTQSCKCLQRECVSKRSRKHGERGYKNRRQTPEYKVWCRMRVRCNSTDARDYHRYGGRGIKVCARWNSYQNFLEDMGRRPSPNHEIDRIDNNGDYEPLNCRWATKVIQARNRRSNRKLTINGETRLLVEWSEISGAEPTTITRRLKLGWDNYSAVFQPVRG